MLFLLTDFCAGHEENWIRNKNVSYSEVLVWIYDTTKCKNNVKNEIYRKFFKSMGIIIFDTLFLFY